MSTQPSPRYLDVPAARLYDEVRGSGPLLFPDRSADSSRLQ
jgi:hypothetical protein